ncbi:MAG: response regulator [Alphaproteobacteria bacterium]|nr:response regulator [Alphaproteobacteria bacterium]
MSADGAKASLHDSGTEIMNASASMKRRDTVADDDRRILIVDDDPDFADALVEMLAINDFVPRAVYDAESAAAAVAEFAPALVFIDIRLGQSSGLDQISRLRAADDTLFCVMITAYADTQTAIEALRRGANDFLRKPLQPEEALAVVYRCLEKRRLSIQAAAMEARLDHLQKSESVARLTGGIAHEFNNMLTVVLGNLQFLAEDIAQEAGPQSAQRVQWINAIDRSARYGAKLTRQLLSYARKERLSPRAIDLSDAMASLRELLDASLGEEVRVGLMLPGDLWPVRVDPSGLEEAIINLGLNARDSMRNGGMVNISIANRRLEQRMTLAETTLSPGEYVAIAVTDTGAGMSDEVRERAFEPFFTTKDTRDGAGLGLSMVQGFAIQSGGGATIESRPGDGTTVTLYLPRASEPDEASAAPDAAAPSPRAGAATAGNDTAAVLIVEDDPDVRDLAATFVEEMGYRCLTAENGARALAILGEGTEVDLLFTDIVMPGGISGLVLWEEAVRRRPGLKVVFTSGNSHSAFHIAEGSGGSHFLRKPYDRSSLKSILAEALADAGDN